MKQIKTIATPVNDSFDYEVNKALADGWVLINRMVVVKPNGDDYLFAELEKEIITEAERCCENCRHFLTDPTEEPCRGCTSDASNWEAAE